MIVPLRTYNQRPENEAPQNRFDNALCNVGTNFKSGVSIEKENHAFVIILPPLGAQGKFKNYYGIFSSGITSVIQAIARQRAKGEIHIILAKPNEFEYDSLVPFMTKEQIDIFARNYDLVKHYKSLDQEGKISYIPLALQDKLIYSFYKNDFKANVQFGIDAVSEVNRNQLARLDFPPYKNFKLNESENYLASSFGFFGGDLSAYITYCAFTNQFINCKLHKISYTTVLWFTKGKVQKQLNEYFEEFFGEDYSEGLFSYSNFQKAYKDFRKRLFTEFTLKFVESNEDSEKWETIHEYKNPFFEQQLLRFVAFLYYNKNYLQEDYINKLNDLEYTRSNYFRDGISSALSVNLEEVSYESKYSERVQAFLNLNYFREKLINKIENHIRGRESYGYLPLNPFPEFIETRDITKFHQVIEYFCEKDDFISNDIFSFKRRVNGTFEKNKISFYKILLQDFFSFEIRKRNPHLKLSDIKEPVLPNIVPITLPTSNSIINLVIPEELVEIPVTNEFLEFVTREYGSWEEYNEQINTMLST